MEYIADNDPDMSYNNTRTTLLVITPKPDIRKSTNNGLYVVSRLAACFTIRTLAFHCDGVGDARRSIGLRRGFLKSLVIHRQGLHLGRLDLEVVLESLSLR